MFQHPVALVNCLICRGVMKAQLLVVGVLRSYNLTDLPCFEKIKGLWDHLAVCVCVYPYFLFFFAVRVVAKESRRLVFPERLVYE
jgi:hypothetical protein